MHRKTDIDYKCRASFSTESVTQILGLFEISCLDRLENRGD